MCKLANLWCWLWCELLGYIYEYECEYALLIHQTPTHWEQFLISWTSGKCICSSTSISHPNLTKGNLLLSSNINPCVKELFMSNKARRCDSSFQISVKNLLINKLARRRDIDYPSLSPHIIHTNCPEIILFYS